MTSLMILNRTLRSGTGAFQVKLGSKEQAVLQIPSLAAWFDPGDNWVTGQTGVGFRWADKALRRDGLRAVAHGSNPPTRTTMGTLNNPALRFGAPELPNAQLTNGSLRVEGAPLIFPRGYTYGTAVSLTATAAGALIGSTENTSGFILGFDSGRLTVSHNADQTFIFRDNIDRRGTSFFLVVAYDYDGKTLSVRINGTTLGQVAGVTQEVDEALMRIGGAGGTTNSNTATGIAVGHVIPFTNSLDVPSRRAQLGDLESYLASQYPVAA